MLRIWRALCWPLIVMPLCAAAQSTAYEAHYRAEVRPGDGVIHVEIKLFGEKLPRRLVFSIDPQRHKAFSSTDSIEVTPKTVTWVPDGRISRLKYDFVVNHERDPGKYDSLMSRDWALFRADRMVPPVAVTARRDLHSRATLEFVLPPQWTAVTPYPADTAENWLIDDPDRRFDRPEGWMLLGKLGKRSETIAEVQTIVAAPSGNSARRQDMLAFLNWNLPRLADVFPGLPKRLLVVTAGDPMWRGGLSGPASLFMHADRPLISENRTSTLLHELVHVAMGIRGDEESDWIVEGFAEYYSLETLRRSGGISKRRHEEAMARQREWATRAPTLFTRKSSGATTARAVMTLAALDEEIRTATRGKSDLDDVARRLASKRGRVSLEALQSAAQTVAGRPLGTLNRAALSKPL